MSETPIPVQHCPYCGYRQNAATYPLGDATPSEGDVSICLNCGKASIFGEGMIARKPTPEEQEKILQLPEVTDAQIARAYAVTEDLREKT